MLTTLTVANPAGSNLQMSIDSYQNGYLITNIEGLDPAKATFTTSSPALLDTITFQNSKLETRNIVISLDLVADFVTTTVSSLRRNLQQYFMPKSEVTLIFTTSDGLSIQTQGRVESFDAPLFVNAPKVTISVMCADPTFEATEPTVVPLTSSVDGGGLYTTISYEGTSPSPIEFEFTNETATPVLETTLTMRNGGLRSGYMTLRHTLNQNDNLMVISTPGGKQITSNGASMLYKLGVGTVWPMLYPGENQLLFITGFTTQQGTLTFRSRFGGL